MTSDMILILVIILCSRFFVEVNRIPDKNSLYFI